MTRDGKELPKCLSGLRLFCVTFVFTFAGVMTNLAAFDLLTLYLNQEEVTRPSSDRPSSQPQLARLAEFDFYFPSAAGPVTCPDE